MEDFVAWGTNVSGATGKVGTPAAKRSFLCLFRLALLQLIYFPKVVMKKFVGLLIHPAMHRREVLSCFHRYFKWVDSFGDETRMTWDGADDVRDDILIASLLMGPCYTGIRWPVDTAISCTDATPSSGGAVKASV